jgi:tetrahydromethanopterin S-methyltransferase subunit F
MQVRLDLFATSNINKLNKMEENTNTTPEQSAPDQESQPIQFFDNVQDLATSMESAPETSISEAAEQPMENEEPTQQDDVQSVQEDYQPVQNNEVPQEQTIERPQYTEKDVEGAVLNYMSEKLGVQINSFEDFIDDGEDEGVYQMDERIEAIARFVEETGRTPQDWFAYQSLNPSEMDDVTAVRVSMASEYPGLNVDELNTLISSKYNMDPDSASEEQVRLAQIQLKADATRARAAIEDIRNGYAAPEVQNQDFSDDRYVIDDNWVSQMSQEVGSLTGLEFDLPNGKTFTYGIDDNYRNQLVNRNARIDEFFDSYVDNSGNWDYDTLASHITVIDKIDEIVGSVYRQGLSDGQKGVVQNAANVKSGQAPQQSEQKESPLSAQLKQIVGGGSNNLMTFNI